MRGGRTPIPRYRLVRLTTDFGFPPRDGCTGVYFNGKLFLYGGWNNTDPTNFPTIDSQDVRTSTNGISYTLETANPGWAEGDHYTPFYEFNGAIWKIGGDVVSGSYETQVYKATDGINFTLVVDDPVVSGVNILKRTLHMGLAHSDGWMYHFGGQKLPGAGFASDPTEALYNDVYKTQDWLTITQVTANAAWSPRGITPPVSYNGEIIIVTGGYYNTPVHTTRTWYKEVWSTVGGDASNWTQKTAPPFMGLQYNWCGVWDSRVWCIAGATSDGTNGNTNGIFYTQDVDNWVELHTDIFSKRHALTCIAAPEGIYILCGSNVGVFPTDVWRLEKN